MLTEKTISELQEILLQEFQIDYSRSEVDEIAISLVSFVDTLLEIDKTDYEEMQPQD